METLLAILIIACILSFAATKNKPTPLDFGDDNWLKN